MSNYYKLNITKEGYSKLVEDILIEIDVEEKEVTFSRNNTIIHELTLWQIDSDVVATDGEKNFFEVPVQSNMNELWGDIIYEATQMALTL